MNPQPSRALIPALFVAAGVMLAACGGSASTTPSTAARAAASAATPLTVKDFTLDPKDVNASGAVALDVTNGGPTIHNVTIRDAAGTVDGATRDLRTGERETLTVSLPPGTYTLFCSLPGHESLGIRGTLVIAP